MRMDSYIFKYCLICKNHQPENNSGMDIFCGKQGMHVNNYAAQKCYAQKYFIQASEPQTASKEGRFS